MSSLTPRQAAEKVLYHSVLHEDFVNLSDGERIVWMLEQAFEMGRSAASATETPSLRPRRRRVGRPSAISRPRREPGDPTNRRSL